MKMNAIVDKVPIPKFANYKLGEENFEKIGKVIAVEIQRAIKDQVRADGGGSLKQNAPSTRRRKIAQGRSPLSLIDKFHRFISGGGAAWVITATDTSVEIEPGGYTGGGKASFSSVSRWVQEADYVGWFDVTTGAVKKIKRILVDSLEEFLSKSKSE